MNLLIKKAATMLGGQTALAQACDSTQSQVWNWIYRDNVITLETACKIQRATKNRIKAAEIRPDYADCLRRVFWTKKQL